MLKVKNDNQKELYDYEVSKENLVKIEALKEGEKPSIISDTMFKTMFYNEKRIKYSAKFISYYLDISYEELLKNIKLTKNSLDKEKEKDKEYRSDYVAIIDDTKINIEVNNNSSEKVLERNLDYAFKLYGSKVKRSKEKESYKYIQVIQFNINNFSFKGNDKIVEVYTLNNREGIKLTNNIVIIEIYIPNLRKKWYTSGIESLSEEERYILALVEPDITSSLKLGKDIDIMEEYIDEVEEVVDDEYFGESYDKELALKEESYNDGIKEGIKQGEKKGTLSTKMEIAKSMLNKAMDISLISELTGLSTDEIKSIK